MKRQNLAEFVYRRSTEREHSRLAFRLRNIVCEEILLLCGIPTSILTDVTPSGKLCILT